MNFPYIDVGQADFNKARASDVISKGCSLGQVLSILGDDYSLLSWSYDKDCTWNARGMQLPNVLETFQIKYNVRDKNCRDKCCSDIGNNSLASDTTTSCEFCSQLLHVEVR